MKQRFKCSHTSSASPLDVNDLAVSWGNLSTESSDVAAGQRVVNCSSFGKEVEIFNYLATERSVPQSKTISPMG